ncbi:MAG: 50S ribosomal protein L15 [Bacteriovoracaceae bacterium]|jgi:large subunit ribosomal protein L15|nr:50S ribosomal protein L15 [Bacteriovoracaceae bacterium]
MLKLNNLSSPKGTHKNIKRIGRGQASGQGQQAGKGHKGQKARAGGGVRTGFIGGAMPLYMRLPKKGFSNAPFKTVYAIVNLDQINEKFTEGEVSRATLIEKGLLSGINKRLPLKVLGNGDLKSALTFVNIDKFSKSATQLIEKSGSKIETK